MPTKEYTQCIRKKRYQTKNQAEEDLSKGRETGYLRQDHKVYHCEFCRKYHIGGHWKW